MGHLTHFSQNNTLVPLSHHRGRRDWKRPHMPSAESVTRSRDQPWRVDWSIHVILRFLATQKGANRQYKKLNISCGQMSNEKHLDCFEEFSQKLIHSLEQTYSSAAECTSNFKVQVWHQFHDSRLTTLHDIWKEFLDALKCDVDLVVQQFTNKELYSSIIKSLYGTCTIAHKAASMSTAEENIVRYAAGYVPFALLKKHKRYLSESSAISCGMSQRYGHQW